MEILKGLHMISTLLIGLVPLACSTTVNLFQNCGHQFEVDVAEILHVSINGVDWVNRALSCEVVVKAESSFDNLHFEVITVYRNQDRIDVDVEGSVTGIGYSVITKGLSVVFVQRTSYRYIRITGRRDSVESQKDYNIMMTLRIDAGSDDVIQPAQNISVGAIVGIIMAVICVFAFVVIGIFCHCYRRSQQSKATALTHIIVARDTRAQGNRGHLTGAVAYTAPPQAASIYPGHTMQPLQVRLPPDMAPPPYMASRMEPLRVQLPIDEGPPPYPGLPEDIKPPM